MPKSLSSQKIYKEILIYSENKNFTFELFAWVKNNSYYTD